MVDVGRGLDPSLQCLFRPLPVSECRSDTRTFLDDSAVFRRRRLLLTLTQVCQTLATRWHSKVPQSQKGLNFNEYDRQ